ncbi:MAG: cytochrome P450 [Chitinophagales bacterium]|nr:cytochrome P450 [Chitinophagales bacterium]MDW8419440.1 cytochrome P450 [Chitinophagales bacterium]
MFICRYFSRFKKPEINQNKITEVLTDIYFNYEKYLAGDDILYLPEINTYAALKYEVVTELLRGNNIAGVSRVHLALNNIYFSPDEEIHQKNKSSALRILPFLSRREQFETKPYFLKLLQIFYDNLHAEHQADFLKFLVTPALFINTLHDFELLYLFPELDVVNSNQKVPAAIETIDRYFDDGDILLSDITAKVSPCDKLNGITQTLLDEIGSHHSINRHDIPKFLRSMIFAASESTIGFSATLAYVYFKQYPELPENSEEFTQLCHEVSRIHTPVPFIYRNVTKNTLYRGKRLHAGDLLALFIGAANLDPAAFPEPHKIQFQRTNKHVAFGMGGYACIGRFNAFGKAYNLVCFLKQRRREWSFANDVLTHRIKNSMLKPQLQFVRHGT